MDLLQDHKRLLMLSALGNLALMGAIVYREFSKKKTEAKCDHNHEQERRKSINSYPQFLTRGVQSMEIDPISILMQKEPIDETLHIGDKEGPSKDVYCICLTGGPCGGKTTGRHSIYLALAEITLRLKKFGIEVYCVPETATLTMLGGGNIIVRNFAPKLAIRREVSRVNPGANHQISADSGKLLQGARFNQEEVFQE